MKAAQVLIQAHQTKKDTGPGIVRYNFAHLCQWTGRVINHLAQAWENLVDVTESIRQLRY